VHRNLRCGAIDLAEIGRGQVNPGGAEIFLETMTFCRARDRYDPGFLRQEPRKRDLRGGRLLLIGKFLEPVDEREIRLAVLLGEARDDIAKIRAVEGGRRVDRAR
jgi:hypothetical protein